MRQRGDMIPRFKLNFALPPNRIVSEREMSGKDNTTSPSASRPIPVQKYIDGRHTFPTVASQELARLARMHRPAGSLPIVVEGRNIEVAFVKTREKPSKKFTFLRTLTYPYISQLYYNTNTTRP